MTEIEILWHRRYKKNLKMKVVMNYLETSYIAMVGKVSSHINTVEARTGELEEICKEMVQKEGIEL